MKKLFIIVILASTSKNVSCQSLPTIQQCEKIYLKEITNNDVNKDCYIDSVKQKDNTMVYHVGVGVNDLYHYVIKNSEITFLFMFKDSNLANELYKKYYSDLINNNRYNRINKIVKANGYKWLISLDTQSDIMTNLGVKENKVFIKIKKAKYD